MDTEKQDLINSIVTDAGLLGNILYYDRLNWRIVNPKDQAKDASEYLNLRYNASCIN
jgi:hypothetical protein